MTPQLIPDTIEALEARRAEFAEDVLNGLQASPKTLPSKYFYDAKGSLLFDRICELEEYYLTRAEIELMRTHASEIAEVAGSRCRLIELGSGSSTKTEILLDHLDDPEAYVPVDISPSYLQSATVRLHRRYPNLRILPVRADYSRSFTLPSASGRTARTIVYFPGSSIGNFSPRDATRLLRRINEIIEPSGAAIIGVDLKKDPAILEAAYNDSEGVTAAFNLNLLERINNELGANFNLSGFLHRAIYNVSEGRIEMYLVSLSRQTVSVAGQSIRFAEGEAVCTEHSYKYGVGDFEILSAFGGLRRAHTWTDSKGQFSVHFLVR